MAVGYIVPIDTIYGIANFWVLGDLHFTQSSQSQFNLTISLVGYPTQDDANTASIAYDTNATTQVLPIGTYTFAMSEMDIAIMFSSAQSLVANAVTGSSPAWANAVYVYGPVS